MVNRYLDVTYIKVTYIKEDNLIQEIEIYASLKH